MIIKHIILFLIFFICLFSFPALSQDQIEEGEVTINDRVYTVSKSTSRYDVKTLWIREDNEYIRKQKIALKPYIKLEQIKFLTIETLKSSVLKALGRDRVIEMSKEKPITMLAYPDYKGKVKAMEFSIPVNHLITMQELDRINSYIKENVSFHMPENIRPDQKISPITQGISFSIY